MHTVAADPLLAPLLEKLHGPFSRFHAPLKAQDRLVCMHDVDADGISAAIVWQRTFERLGFANLHRIMPSRERNVWSPDNLARAQAAQPDALFVMDLGCQPQPVVAGVRSCFVDHHRPGDVSPHDTLLSGYGFEPTPNTSLIAWELCQPLADISDLDWIAALGVLSDLGDKAPFQIIAQTKKRYTAKYLRETVSLVNAARRAPQFTPEQAAQALLTHASPKELVQSSADSVQSLRDAQAEVRAALLEAKKAAPSFAGKVALVRIHSACQVHPLIAQIWRTRLPKYAVVVANDGYVPGRINFSARAANLNVLELLRGVNVPAGEGSYGQGHDQASGGSLPPERYAALMRGLGFSDQALGPLR